MINGRYIRSFPITKAILQAYHTLLPVHRFPLAVLHIQMEPELIDVNVHPAKLEVRFSKEVELTQFLTDIIRGQLDQILLIPQGKSPVTSRPKPEQIQEQLPLYDDVQVRKTSTTNSPSMTREEKVDPMAVRHFMEGLKQPEKVNPRSSEQEIVQQSSESSLPISDPVGNPVGNPVDDPVSDSVKVPVDERLRMPKLHAIGQMRSTYIVAQNEEGLYLIDQHAAHERLNYEYYYDKFGQPTKASQELILPLTLEFTSAEADILNSRLHCLEQVGVYMEPFGGNTFKVTAYPHWFPQGDEKTVIEEMVEWVLREKTVPDLAKLREKSAILCSCKASIKANQRLSQAEIEALLNRLMKASNPFTCPHGRPIMVRFSNYDLEKMFKRVM